MRSSLDMRVSIIRYIAEFAWRLPPRLSRWRWVLPDDAGNRRDRSRIDQILHPDVSFRGSLGAERHGHEEYWRYVEEITGPLADYRCDEITSVSDDQRVFARMRFGGRHVGEFRGFAPTGEMVEWQGAALFEIDSGLITSVWVLGDLAALDALLERQARRS